MNHPTSIVESSLIRFAVNGNALGHAVIYIKRWTYKIKLGIFGYYRFLTSLEARALGFKKIESLIDKQMTVLFIPETEW
jgi:hypothetical protein